MLVLPPLESATRAQLAGAALALVLTPALVSIARVVRRKMRVAKGLAPIPGPAGVPLLGVFPDLVKNFERWYDFQEDLMVEYGGRCKLPPNIFTDGTIMLASADDVKHVLGTNVNNYVKSDAMVAAFHTLFGNSFFCLNHHAHAADGGAMWRLQRKLASKVFTTTNFKLFTQELFLKYAREMADGIAAQGGRCNMADVSTHYTLRTIFDITCGVPVKQVDAEMGLSFMRCITFAVNNIIDRLLKRPYYRYLWWCMPSEYQLQRDVAVVRRIMDYILAPRLAESDAQLAQRSDILSLFIQKARELEHGEGQAILDVRTLRDVLGTFIIAGWDTTASFITYLCYALAQYPDVQQKVYDELAELGDADALTYDDVKKLKYLDAVAMETQRVYPSLPFNTKIAVNDDHLPDGTFVPAGTEVVYSAWYMGRHSAIWGDDPLVFRPERWLEMKTRPSAFEFPVFQAGPRICIGMNLALLESKMFVAVMLQRFHMAIQDGERVANRPYKMATILLLDGGLPLQMTPRSSGAARGS